MINKLLSTVKPISKAVDTYRGRKAEKVVINPFQKEGTLVPIRVRRNNSPTKANSEAIETSMRKHLMLNVDRYGSSNPAYDIPYIPEKAIILSGSTTSTNVLDSLAKYAGMHNRNPQLSEKPIRKASSYGKPRRINLDEMLGLSTHETKNGAMPQHNFASSDTDRQKALDIPYREYNRALGNSNYLTAFDYVPAEFLVRNFHYNQSGISKNTPPLLDAFRYYAEGDYNTGDKGHTNAVNNAGKLVWKNPKVKEWWETSGKYYYETGKGPDNRRTLATGGSIYIKPSHRGRLTELKARTGKSEAELYSDGNPAHKKMVVFARNARKWKH